MLTPEIGITEKIDPISRMIQEDFSVGPRPSTTRRTGSPKPEATPVFQSLPRSAPLKSGSVTPGLLLTGVIAAAAMGLRQTSGVALLSPLLVAVVAGMVIGMIAPPGAALRPGMVLAARPVLRLGIMLLGFQLTLGQLAALGPGAFLVAAGTLALTFAATRAAAPLLGVSRDLGDLIATGTAVCGASAVMAAASTIRAEDEDATYAIACVTVFGTLLMLVAPWLAAPLGLSPEAYGIWVGASVHEVAQVTAAAFQLGPEAGQAGTVTKLIRVMLLAPLILVLARLVRGTVSPGDAATAVPLPWFVFGFIAVMLANSLLPLPAILPQTAAPLATFCLAAGLAAMGLQVTPGRLRARGLRPLLLAALATVLAAGFAWTGLLLLG